LPSEITAAQTNAPQSDTALLLVRTQAGIADILNIGPRLTLDTAPVEMLRSRVRRNQLDLLSAAEAEAQIKLIKAFSESPLVPQAFGILLPKPVPPKLRIRYPLYAQL
jgi:hypothetical protein